MKFLLTIFLLSSSAFAAADGCWPLLQAEAKRINERDGYQENVGGQVYVLNGQIGYWPGITVDANIDNWAEDLERSISYGPQLITFGNQEDPQKEILEMFRKDLADDCILPTENYKSLQGMLKELMDEGAFCPDNKLLNRPLLGRWKNYKRVLRENVRAGRFQEQCQSVAIQDSVDRDEETVAVPVLVPGSPAATEQ
jgi:hypothetical protein